MDSHPFREMDQSFEVMGQHGEYFNGNALENAASLGLVGFSGNSCFIQQPELMVPNLMDKISDLLPAKTLKLADQPTCSTQGLMPGEKREAMLTPQATYGGSSALPLLTDDKSKKRSGSGGGKRGRSNSKEVGEKQKDVVHVRARRGQATDSHSLAERVRREKINERMRCLQDLVPGCYKTMGMAGILDEIINYVQSLQNQVEFLSMKLSAASSAYDFNMDAAENTAGDIYEEQMKRLAREGYGRLH